MVEVFWRYRVHPMQARAFEEAYGPQGPWARLFAKHAGFRRVRLFKHRVDPQVYLTIDVWDSKAAWDEFRREHRDEYHQLDKQLALLKLEEHMLGFYDGSEEYRAPADADASV